MTASYSTRSTHAESILGPEFCSRLKDTKVLLVGAGGIGCELLKNLVLTGFGQITLLDLDTIDLSNLNRQFLFRKKDVKQSKCMVAAQVASEFNPNVKIHPIFGNIKEPQFDVHWFQQFDIILNALDNLDARRHVNKMCIAANVPLVESGTAGYLGQVQPLLKDRTECFDCIPKPAPKSFPVCTIRSTPSQPIHCIVWGKSYLMGQLFGEDEDAGGELDDAEKQGENSQEIANLRKEAQAFQAVRAALRSPNEQPSNAAKMVFQKVFNSDIRNVLSMADMWRSRTPPQPLDYDSIMNETFKLENKSSSESNGSVVVNGNGNVTIPQPQGPQASTGSSNLKDQKKLSLLDNLQLFSSSVNRLAIRLQSGEEMISFDKDDDDTLDFVTAAANLRSAAYGIDGKTRWEVKEMAGNIIPAIATTNAVISGLIVLQALHILKKSYHQLKNVHIQLKPSVPLSSIALSKPVDGCGVCRDTYISVRCDPSRTRLCDLVQAVLQSQESEEDSTDVSVYEDKRLLSDPDFDDNNERTLESLNVTRGKFLTIVDEDGERGTIVLALGILEPNHPPDGPSFVLSSPVPTAPKKVKKPNTSLAAPLTPPRASLKRNLSEVDASDDIPTAKRVKQDATLESPSKKRRLEEDGLIMLDNLTEKLDDDVIEID
jgi:ubiquitin-like 1-activating enzyme E1 B